MNGQQLKNSILQLAIQGRLVPQYSNDEPASALLARIREEKQRLVKDKKIKKEKPLAPITDEEKPFDIPETWEWVRLGEIANLYIGKTPERSNPLFWNDGKYPWISISDMREYGYISSTKECISTSAASTCFKRISHVGALIMSFKLTVGRTSILNVDAYHNEAIVTIERYCDDNNYIRDYLFYTLPKLANLGDSKDAIKGKTLNSTSLNNLIIPIPPLAEQHRIVEKIEELLPLVEEYDEAQKKLDKLNDELPEMLKKSVLQQAVMGKLDTRNDDDEPASVLLKRIKEEKAKLIKEKKIKKEKPLAPITDDEKPFDIPESWEWVRIIDIANSQLGKTLDRGKDSGEEYPYLCSINIYWDGIDLNNVKYFKLQENEKEKYRVEKNDLLVCEGGEVARCCVWDFEMEIYYQNALHRIRFYQKINPYFYKYVIQVYKALGIIKGRGQTILHFTYTEMKKLCFPLPPLAEQHRIVEKIEELLPLIDEMKKT